MLATLERKPSEAFLYEAGIYRFAGFFCERVREQIGKR
jgi:hypothetical protein